MKKLLSTLLEQYKHANSFKQKQHLINEFKERIWKSRYKFQTFKKMSTYSIDESLLNNRQDLIQLFKKYQVIEIKYCKSVHRGKNMDSFDYIRIHINNMYGYLVNKDVYLNHKYYQLLLAPKDEYYKTIQLIKNGGEANADKINARIENSWKEAKELKKHLDNKKLNIDWKTYKDIIDKYIEKIFNNYQLPEEYEKKHGWLMLSVKDGGMNENYATSYFCKSLTGYMRMFIHNNKRNKHKYCKICGKEISIHSNRIYCKECSFKVAKEKHNIRQKRYINKK